MSAKFEKLKARQGKIADLKAAEALLSWDQETYMPPGAAEARATQLSTVAKTAHAWFVADEIGQILEDLEAEMAKSDYDSLEGSLLRATRRQYDRQRKLPSKLVARLTKAIALAQAAWQKARTDSDFDHFQPHLEQILDLTIQKAEMLGYGDRIYDALLDGYEPQMKTAQVHALFGEMKASIYGL